MKRLLIFAKAPVIGLVKTRLAESIGDMAALKVYRWCVETTLKRLANLSDEIIIYVDSKHHLDLFKHWVGPQWKLALQQGEDLGERLAQASQEIFDEGCDRIIFIGTDSPWIAEDDIKNAFLKLDSSDIVIGPTDDGGYYLVGLSKPHASIFNNVTWGSSDVFEQTVENAKSQGLIPAVLDRDYDIDRVDDFERLFNDQRLINETAQLEQFRLLQGGKRNPWQS